MCYGAEVAARSMSGLASRSLNIIVDSSNTEVHLEKFNLQFCTIGRRPNHTQLNVFYYKTHKNNNSTLTVKWHFIEQQVTICGIINDIDRMKQ